MSVDGQESAGEDSYFGFLSSSSPKFQKSTHGQNDSEMISYFVRVPTGPGAVAFIRNGIIVILSSRRSKNRVIAEAEMQKGIKKKRL